MFEEYKDERYAAPPLLRRMVLAGQLGPQSRQRLFMTTGSLHAAR